MILLTLAAVARAQPARAAAHLARAARRATLLEPPRAGARVAARPPCSSCRMPVREPPPGHATRATVRPQVRRRWPATRMKRRRNGLLELPRCPRCGHCRPARASCCRCRPASSMFGSSSWDLDFFLPLLDGRESTVLTLLPSNRMECYFRIRVLSFSGILRNGILLVVFSESRDLSML